MPITLSQQDYWDLVCETRCNGNFCDRDEFDVTWQYPERLGQGTYREIQLRQGVELAMNHYQLHDNVILQCPERSHPLEYVFAIAGKPTPTSIAAGQYLLCGSGMAPVEKWEHSAMADLGFQLVFPPNSEGKEEQGGNVSLELLPQLPADLIFLEPRFFSKN